MSQVNSGTGSAFAARLGSTADNRKLTMNRAIVVFMAISLVAYRLVDQEKASGPTTLCAHLS